MAESAALAAAAAPGPGLPRSKTGATVTIACKLPVGLWAELIDMEDAHASSVVHNGDKIMIRPKLGRVFLRGVARERRLERADENGRLADHEPLQAVAGGFGLTTGVDADWAAAWFEQNRDYPPVAQGLIFMAVKPEVGRAKALERAELRSGQEPIDPKNPKRDRRNVGAVDPDLERHKALA
jgi:hypothetical protein